MNDCDCQIEEEGYLQDGDYKYCTICGSCLGKITENE